MPEEVPAPGSDRRQALTVLDAVLEAATAERRRVLDAACAGDPTLRREVESMLGLEKEAQGFLAAPWPAGGGASFAPGTRLGPWELREALGRGGMGAVYRAVRAEDYRTEVAIKVLLEGGFTGGAWQRFHRERQILAQLDHPAIARLLDGGTVPGAPGALPYLVMELVEGEPIDVYCQRRSLSLPGRLELFLEVCGAVEFAHRNLIVHRDLKPGNILVRADGRPKLLDFGIAKLLGDGSADPSLTGAGGSPMTPRYASPEQIAGGPITTATDVYALGVLLYELLTGDLPNQLRDAGPAEVARRIRDEEPRPPSQIPPPAGRRKRSRLRGDLDAVTLRALRKDPRDRYPSVAALADDLRRHLEGLPVDARRNHRWYVAGRYLRRYRGWLAAGAALLLAGAGLLIRESRRLEHEQLRSQRLEAVLEELILTADPDTGALTPDKLLERAEQQIGALEGEPRLRGELLDSLGFIHRKLGHSDRALALAAESLRQWRELGPAADQDLVLRVNNLGALLLDRGDYPEAETLFREALALRERLGESDSEDATTNRANLGATLLYGGRWEEAEALLSRVLADRRRLLAAEDPKIAASLRSLAALRHARGDFEGAEPLLREALALRRAALGDDHTEVAAVFDLLGQTLFGRGELDEAEQALGRAAEIRRRRLGPDHPSTAWSELGLGQVLLAAGDPGAARLLIVRAWSVLRESEEPAGWRLAHAESVAGGLFLAERSPEKARPCLEGAVARLSATRGDDATYTRQARLQLARLHSPSVP